MLLPRLGKSLLGEDREVNKSLEISVTPISFGVMYKDLGKRKEHTFVGGYGACGVGWWW